MSTCIDEKKVEKVEETDFNEILKKVHIGDYLPQIVDICYDKKTGKVGVAIHPELRGKVEVRVVEWDKHYSQVSSNIYVYDGIKEPEYKW